jgi:hypothetical protein
MLIGVAMVAHSGRGATALLELGCVNWHVMFQAKHVHLGVFIKWCALE